jgi:hypothetical protein
MELDELVSVLVAEHAKMKEGLAQVRQATSNKDFVSASRILKELNQDVQAAHRRRRGQVLRILLCRFEPRIWVQILPLALN